MNNTPQPVAAQKAAHKALHNAAHIDFGYFMEGPRSAWTHLFQQALLEDIGLEAIQGSAVLNMGASDGRVASCLALLGAAHVTGIDSPEIDLSVARAEVKKHAVGDRVDFSHYDGDLSRFNESGFDLIVTKSALVVEPNLNKFLSDLSRTLNSSGRVVFLENAKGGRVIEFLRAVRHRKWGYSRANMFTEAEVQIVRQHFVVQSATKSRWPPVYKIVGNKAV